MNTGKKFILLSSLLLVTVALSACATVSPLSARRPQEQQYRTALRKELSNINVPVEASADQLAHVLNQMVAGELYKGSAEKISGLNVRISRNGPIAVSAADNYLYVAIPIKMSFSYSLFSTKDIPLKLKFKLSAAVTPDWKITTDVYYTGISELLTEDFSIGPLSIKPRSTIENLTRPLQKTLSDVISRSINDKLSVKTTIETAWKDIQKPILLDNAYKAWLKITPREVMLYPFYARNNQFRIAAGITSFAELIVGAEPPFRSPAPLPPLKQATAFDRSFRVALNADLSYRDIVAAASPLLLNRDFGSDGKQVILRNFDLYGNGDRIVIQIETSGSLAGTFYLTGKPQFNPQANMFSVVDVDFEMQTRDVLLKTADWFLHGTIKSTIQDKLDMNMADKLKETQAMLQTSLASIKLHDHLVLKGTVTALKISDVVVQKDKISLQLYSEGETGISLQ